LVQLESERSRFEALGVSVAAMTYDSVEILKAFKAAERLGYPLLHDAKAKHVNLLGVRNTEYAEGHMAYGVPHPGILFLRPNGEVALTFAVPGYRQRPPIEDVLAAVTAGVSE
jgi:peroxiredoxin